MKARRCDPSCTPLYEGGQEEKKKQPDSALAACLRIIRADSDQSCHPTTGLAKRVRDMGLRLRPLTAHGNTLTSPTRIAAPIQSAQIFYRWYHLLNGRKEFVSSMSRLPCQAILLG